MGSRGLLPLLLALLLLFPLPALADDWTGQADPAGAPDDQAAPATAPRVAPVVVKIPALGVDADIYPVGEDADGAMMAPSDPDTVAWWSLGPGTGEPGNVVLAGHVDWGGRLRVFGLISRLAPGDEIVVVDERLREFHYQVVWSKQVAAEGAPVGEIFASSDVPELTLITCGGAFDRASHQYLDRVIVRAAQV